MTSSGHWRGEGALRVTTTTEAPSEMCDFQIGFDMRVDGWDRCLRRMVPRIGHREDGMAFRDSKGRPLVAVTGMGMVTSLGQGKDDTFAAMTAGRSGIHRINRFPIEGLRTTIAGTIDYVDADRSARRVLRASRLLAPTRPSVSPACARAISRARCSSRCRRSKWNGRSGKRLQSLRRQRRQRHLQGPAGGPVPGGSRTGITSSSSVPWPTSRGRVRHQGLADLPVDRLLLGRHRDPARRRSDPPRRNAMRPFASAPTAR